LALINPEFIDASKLLPILCIGLIGQAYASVCNYSDVLQERYRFSLVRNLFVLSFQTVVSIWAIQRSGAFGAAVTIGVVPLIANCIINLFKSETKYLNSVLISRFRPSVIKEVKNDIYKSFEAAVGRAK
jgi:hypothetical protein